MVSRFKTSQVEPDRAVEHLTVARDAMRTLIDNGWATADQRPWMETIETALAEVNQAPGDFPSEPRLSGSGDSVEGMRNEKCKIVSARAI